MNSKLETDGSLVARLTTAGGLLALTAFGPGPLALEARLRSAAQPSQVGSRSLTPKGVQS